MNNLIAKNPTLSALSMLVILVAVQTLMVAPDILHIDVSPLSGLATLITGLADGFLQGHSEFQHTAVTIPGAVWLLISGWSFTGWFRSQV